MVNFREAGRNLRWWVAIVIIPWLLVGAILVLPMLFGARLPSEIATHWGANLEPDGSMSLLALGILQVVIVGGTWGALAAYGRNFMPPSPSVATAYFLFGLFLAAQVSIVERNLDAVDWRDAGTLTGPTLPLVLLAATIMGVVGFVLAGGVRNGGTGQ